MIIFTRIHEIRDYSYILFTSISLASIIIYSTLRTINKYLLNECIRYFTNELP